MLQKPILTLPVPHSPNCFGQFYSVKKSQTTVNNATFVKIASANLTRVAIIIANFQASAIVVTPITGDDPDLAAFHITSNEQERFYFKDDGTLCQLEWRAKVFAGGDVPVGVIEVYFNPSCPQQQNGG